MQNEFISRETFWIAGLLPAFFAGQVSTQLRCPAFLQVKSLRSFAALLFCRSSLYAASLPCFFAGQVSTQLRCPAFLQVKSLRSFAAPEP